jgi:hypothetical protein
MINTNDLNEIMLIKINYIYQYEISSKKDIFLKFQNSDKTFFLIKKLQPTRNE